MLNKVNRSDLGPIDQSFDIFFPVVSLTKTDKTYIIQKGIKQYHVCGKDKRDRESRCFW